MTLELLTGEEPFLADMIPELPAQTLELLTGVDHFLVHMAPVPDDVPIHLPIITVTHFLVHMAPVEVVVVATHLPITSEAHFLVLIAPVRDRLPSQLRHQLEER